MPHRLWRLLDRLLCGARAHREPLSLCVDALVVWLAWQVTYLFRLGFERWFSARPGYDLPVALGLTAAYTLALWSLQVPRTPWRFTGFGEVRRLALACLVAGGLGGLAVWGVLQLEKVPRAVLALHPFVALMGLCAVRLLHRLLVEQVQARLRGPQAPPRPALVLGAGEAARRLVAGIQGQGWNILGLLDDDPHKQGRRVGGQPVLGTLADLPELAVRCGATHLILALPSVQGSVRRRIIEDASRTGLPLLTVPSAQELQEGGRAQRIRDVEPDDLLGRDPVELDDAPVAQHIGHHVVLVTGAGGSIGQELCLQIAALGPAQLILLELSEFALYRLEQRLRERHPHLAITPVIADIQDPQALDLVFSRWRPHLVFHAAAYKHVPMLEGHNAAAALRNNSLGTWVAARTAAVHGAARFVLVSTDKAVNPTNVMGASKRAAERLLASLVAEHPHTRFIAVRFGNVLGSSGSVIPRFKAQIARGGPITVTHPDIIRYFMTIPEACRLVLQAAAWGESGQVLLLEMGQPVKIVDLARSLIRLSGHREDEIPIVYTGLRPGEKLYEELLADEESTDATAVAGLRLARLRDDLSAEQARQWVAQAHAIRALDEAAVKRHLQALVPEYRPASSASGPAPHAPLSPPEGA